MMASGTKIPRIELADMGPNMDFTLRRSHLAADELMKQACRQPKEATVSAKSQATVVAAAAVVIVVNLIVCLN